MISIASSICYWSVSCTRPSSPYRLNCINTKFFSHSALLISNSFLQIWQLYSKLNVIDTKDSSFRNINYTNHGKLNKINVTCLKINFRFQKDSVQNCLWNSISSPPFDNLLQHFKYFDLLRDDYVCRTFYCYFSQNFMFPTFRFFQQINFFVLKQMMHKHDILYFIYF